jgi:soluble lytic murein transglycosylase
MKRIYLYLFTFLFLSGVTLVTFVFPLDYFPEVSNASKEYQVDKATIYSIIKIESNFRGDVCSYKGAIGLMQIMPPTGKWIADLNNIPYSDEMLLDPDYNIKIGTFYLSYLLKRYHGDMEKVLIAYNAGPSRLKDGTWKNFKETKNYIIKYKIVNFFYKIRVFIKN